MSENPGLQPLAPECPSIIQQLDVNIKPDFFHPDEWRRLADEWYSFYSGREVLITNTVFFEGIPTLNQYGMAIMALLMLGVGFVGFRRFV